ncbi:hypothetical protein EJB00_00240 [Wolbachia endosymbiont of Drosophila mauritiana]|nr:hypothetical protein EJA99_00240 [Wolbachia endosymbiont of Drosophila mauritiana]QCB63190.1 hypothetical protein EJB00_00240 [Wolbachia endosymbiont of Drosophila mauritiana]TGB07440.1 hypothetical protein E5C28_01200 [Wolbachia endosymbiont of Drosophila mauritiana]
MVTGIQLFHNHQNIDYFYTRKFNWIPVSATWMTSKRGYWDYTKRAT